ncbi:MAG TPA: ATP-binding cassette domain-containing protein [Phycisphaerales bacterium]|nr:ATP-binding cassette domain-containing protein [Phycisphaerales bacterium]
MEAVTSTREHDQDEARTNPLLLEVRNVVVEFAGRRGLMGKGKSVRALDGVSLRLERGKTLGVVGESGSGKSTLARVIVRLTAAKSGEVFFEGRNALTLGRGEMRAVRREMQMVFQDPAGSLNPRMRVGAIVGEPLIVHGIVKGKAAWARAEEAMEECGLERGMSRRYPHEFSGGQRQRIAIARAMILRPKLVICDEPTSALDVSVQAQILNLLKDLQERMGLAYLFISHDIAVVNHMSDEVAVMKDGRIVEEGVREEVLERPKHEYTQALLSAVPGQKSERLSAVGGR